MPRTQKEIFVPALVENGRIIVPNMYLGNEIKYRTRQGKPLSAAEYQSFNLPTLAELMHAFFDKTAGGVFVSPEYRQSMLPQSALSTKRYEWTSTFLWKGKELIEKPERVFYDEKHELWIAEARIDNIHRVETPNNGWVLEYDKSTGFPSRTSKNKKKAENKFGGDASYFDKSEDGLRAVLWSSSLIGAGYRPGDRSSDFGARYCRRPE